MFLVLIRHGCFVLIRYVSACLFTIELVSVRLVLMADVSAC